MVPRNTTNYQVLLYKHRVLVGHLQSWTKLESESFKRLLVEWLRAQSYFEVRKPRIIKRIRTEKPRSRVSRPFLVGFGSGLGSGLGLCYKDYPELGNPSIFYPHSSVVNAFTFGVVRRTRVRISLERFFYGGACACVPEHVYLSGSPGIGTKRVGQSQPHTVPTPQRSRRSEGGRVL